MKKYPVFLAFVIVLVLVSCGNEAAGKPTNYDEVLTVLILDSVCIGNGWCRGDCKDLSIVDTTFFCNGYRHKVKVPQEGDEPTGIKHR